MRSDPSRLPLLLVAPLLAALLLTANACDVEADDVVHALSGGGGGGAACTNEGDLTVLQSFASGALEPYTRGERCSLVSCGTDESCVSTCIREGDGDSGVMGTWLSEACSDCYAMGVVCSVESCTAACWTGGDETACETCVAEQCGDDFCGCIGWELCNAN